VKWPIFKMSVDVCSALAEHGLARSVPTIVGDHIGSPRTRVGRYSFMSFFLSLVAKLDLW
jgi:hypothetical protein